MICAIALFVAATQLAAFWVSRNPVPLIIGLFALVIGVAEWVRIWREIDEIMKEENL